MTLDLLITGLLVLANGFFVGTEFAIARLRPTQVAEFERERRPGAKSVRHAVEHIDSYLSACQLGITLASIGLGVVGKPVFEDLLEPVLGDNAALGGVAMAATLAFSIVTLLHVVVGELAPKSFAIARTGPAALALAPPMRVFYLLTKPVVDLFNAMGNLLLKPFGIPPAREAGYTPHTEDELRTLLRQSAREGLIDVEERRLTENVFTFGDRRAREIMVPRPEVSVLTTAEDLRAAADKVLETGHTRFPLVEPEGGLDAVVGFVHAKSLLAAALARSEQPLRELARPIVRVSESVLLDELLRELRRDHVHVALVLDEHGTTVGIVTMEDVLEELVGEIEDEFDTEHDVLIERDGDRALVAGSTPVRLVAEELEVHLENAHEATIGGHVVERLGRLPETGEVVRVDGLEIEVTAVDEARITALAVAREAPAPD